MLRARAGNWVMSRLLARIAPEVGTSSPAIIRSVVVLPQPLGPRIESISPRSTAMFRSWTARVAPNSLVRCESSRCGISDKRIPMLHPFLLLRFDKLPIHRHLRDIEIAHPFGQLLAWNVVAGGNSEELLCHVGQAFGSVYEFVKGLSFRQMFGSFHDSDGIRQDRSSALGNHVIERKPILRLLQLNVRHVPERQRGFLAPELLQHQCLIGRIVFGVRVELLQPLVSKLRTFVRTHFSQNSGAENGADRPGWQWITDDDFPLP